MRLNDSNWSFDDDGAMPQRVAHDDDAPDLTERIMNRLGYIRVSSQAAQRDRRRRLAGRALMLTLLIAGGAFAMHLHSISERARRPIDQPVPAAISNELRDLRDGVRTLRHIMPEAPAAVPAPHRHAPVGRPGGEAEQSRVPWSGLL